MKWFVLLVALGSNVALGRPSREEYPALKEAFDKAGCMQLAGSEIVQKQDDHEYDILVNPAAYGRVRKAVLLTKTATFSSAGIVDDPMGMHLKGKRKVRLQNGFSEEWEVWEESAICTKQWKLVQQSLGLIP